MTNKQALQALIEYNNWIRGNSESTENYLEIFKPTQIALALDKAIKQLQQLAVLDKLCPKPSEFGEYNWSSIDRSEEVCLSEDEPIADIESGLWNFEDHDYKLLRTLSKPTPDWTKCRWSKEQAIEIHGDI